MRAFLSLNLEEAWNMLLYGEAGANELIQAVEHAAETAGAKIGEITLNSEFRKYWITPKTYSQTQ